jgi:hypothetical protein
MKILEWIQVLFGLLAIGSGSIVLHGVLKVELSRNRVARFLRYSLIASVVGFVPLTPHMAPIQGICMVSVYCAGAVVLAWRKFRLAGLWRPVFAFFTVGLLYLNVASVSIRLFRYFSELIMASAESGSLFGITEFAFASVFAVLAVLAVRTCHPQRRHSF